MGDRRGDCKSLAGFKNDYMCNRTEIDTTTPTGRPTTKLINPVDVWIADPNCLKIDGFHLRPDRKQAIIKDGKFTLLNTYRSPVHGLADNTALPVLMAFVEHLVPDPVERSSTYGRTNIRSHGYPVPASCISRRIRVPVAAHGSA